MARNKAGQGREAFILALTGGSFLPHSFLSQQACWGWLTPSDGVQGAWLPAPPWGTEGGIYGQVDDGTY